MRGFDYGKYEVCKGVFWQIGAKLILLLFASRYDRISTTDESFIGMEGYYENKHF